MIHVIRMTLIAFSLLISKTDITVTKFDFTVNLLGKHFSTDPSKPPSATPAMSLSTLKFTSEVNQNLHVERRHFKIYF